MPKFDSLGDRMKFYEQEFGRSSAYLMPLVPGIIRLDGRAFHTFTKDLTRPFDEGFVALMDETTKALVEETDACIGYTQSDEITLVLYTRFYNQHRYFDGRINKINSLLASRASQIFANGLKQYIPLKAGQYPQFDCRCFSVPTREEGVNAILWREQDAVRNSIQMLGQAHFSQEQLQNKNCNEIQEMLFSEHGINWDKLAPRLKRGGYFQKKIVETPFTVEEIETLPEKHNARSNPDLKVSRRSIVELDLPILTKLTNREAVIFNGAKPKICDT